MLVNMYLAGGLRDNNVPDGSTNIFIPGDADHWPLFEGNLSIGINCGNIIIDKGAQLTVNGSISVNPGRNLIIKNNGALYQSYAQ